MSSFVRPWRNLVLEHLFGLVGDDGHRIPADKRETVFEAGSSTSAVGTGFGLSLVKQIVAAHDWEVNV